jgi:hypothetical protein
LQDHGNQNLQPPAPQPAAQPQHPQQPAQQHGQQVQHGAGEVEFGREPWADYRSSVWEQGTRALDNAVDKTNDAWGEEMKRRSEAAQAQADREHELDMAQMEQDALARHDAYEADRDRQKQAFLSNLLGNHTVTFGG